MMARPKKLTLDFYIHDSYASEDTKIKKLERKFGLEGFGFYCKMLEYLCREDDIRLDLSDPDTAELYAEEFRMRDVQHLYKLIQYCSDINLFDKQLWESDRTVFSPGLFNRYVSRLEERQAAATRKKRSRDAAKLKQKIEDAEKGIVTGDNGVTKELSQECPSPEPQNLRTSELQNSKEECVPIPSHNPAALMEDRFNGVVDSFPWVTRIINRYQREYEPEMLTAVIEYLKTTPSWEKKIPANSDAMAWLSVCHKPQGVPERENRIERAFIVWESAQKLKQRENATPRQSDDERKEVLSHLYRNWGGVPS